MGMIFTDQPPICNSLPDEERRNEAGHAFVDASPRLGVRNEVAVAFKSLLWAVEGDPADPAKSLVLGWSTNWIGEGRCRFCGLVPVDRHFVAC
jgi:hypothetical protein